MNFTPKIKVGPVTSGILAIAVVGLTGWVGHVLSAPSRIVATHDAFTVQESFQPSGHFQIVPAVELTQAPALQGAESGLYQPVTAWYKNKHWWKKNAPIIGGAAGGGLIGGLAGGGKGALIGGAAGGGGGYLYKRLSHSHHHHQNHPTYNNHPYSH